MLVGVALETRLEQGLMVLLIWNDNGMWVIWFEGFFGYSINLSAQLLYILHGLKVAWELD